MCLDEYFMQTIVRDRQKEAEAWAAREAMLASFRTPWRVSIGRALVRLGQRLTAGAPRHIQPSLS